MADFSDKMKKAWLKSMEAIGNTAGNIASNTRYKVNEMTLLNRRREILSDFGARAYDLWQKGETFPEELARQLEELSQVDTQLNALRMERLAGVKTSDGDEGAPEVDASAEQAAPEAGDAAAPKDAADGDVPPAQDLPDGKSQLADMANQALDTIGNTLKNVGSFLGGAITSVTDTLTGKKAAPTQDAADAENSAPTEEAPQDAPETPNEGQPADAPSQEDETEEEVEEVEETEEETKQPAGEHSASTQPVPQEDDENPDEYKVE